jgi:16S rRNA (uracil1498-N3)-methyltransferase
MVRFFAASKDVTDTVIKLGTEDSEHVRSLRLRPDELFIVCDGDGNDYVCRLGKRDGCSVAEVVEKKQSRGEPSVKCRVFIAYSKGDRLDYAVQKSVELGAHSIFLFESSRCVAVPRDIAGKTARLQRIALETAKQSGRGTIPGVTAAGGFDSMLCESEKLSAISLFFYEYEDTLHIKKVLERHLKPLHEHGKQEFKPVSIITGPEGGFDPHEVELAKSKGFQIVSLGPRVLRSETAPVVALATVMYHTDNL